MATYSLPRRQRGRLLGADAPLMRRWTFTRAHARSLGELGDAESERVAVSRGPFLGPVSRPGTRDLSVALYSRIGSNLKKKSLVPDLHGWTLRLLISTAVLLTL